TADLEAALEPAFAEAADRRLASRELMAFLVAARAGGERLPNVAAILQAQVPAATVARTAGLTVYAERLRAAQDAAVKGGRAAPERIRLFSPGDLAAVKPRLSVRSERMFQQQALTCAALAIAGFHA